MALAGMPNWARCSTGTCNGCGPESRPRRTAGATQTWCPGLFVWLHRSLQRSEPWPSVFWAAACTKANAIS